MKKVLLILSLVFIFSCSEDELTYDDSNWSTANGIIKPDTLKKVININPDNFQSIFRASLSSPSFPTEDTLSRRFVFASHFKKGLIFGEVENFYLNDNKLTFYKQLLYPCYYYNTESYFSLSDSVLNLKYIENDIEYKKELIINDPLENIEISGIKLDKNIDINFDSGFDIYSIHAFYLNYNELGVISNLSLNKTYEYLTSDNKITIDKLLVEKAIKDLGYSLEFVKTISFSLIATDTSEVMIGNRNTLIYKSSEKIITLDY